MPLAGYHGDKLKLANLFVRERKCGDDLRSCHHGTCKRGAPPRPSDGCGHELDFWFKQSTLHPPPSKPKPALTLVGLPAACKQIVKVP
jgi:murein endopeptidase